MTATTEELTALLAHRDRDPWVATVGSSSQERPHTIASGHHLIVISHVFGPYDAANLRLMALAPELAEEVVRLRNAQAELERLVRLGFSRGWDSIDQAEHLDRLDVVVSGASNAVARSGGSPLDALTERRPKDVGGEDILPRAGATCSELP